jgi:hypothetical protein
MLYGSWILTFFILLILTGISLPYIVSCGFEDDGIAVNVMGFIATIELLILIVGLFGIIQRHNDKVSENKIMIYEIENSEDFKDFNYLVENNNYYDIVNFKKFDVSRGKLTFLEFLAAAISTKELNKEAYKEKLDKELNQTQEQSFLSIMFATDEDTRKLENTENLENSNEITIPITIENIEKNTGTINLKGSDMDITHGKHNEYIGIIVNNTLYNLNNNAYIIEEDKEYILQFNLKSLNNQQDNQMYKEMYTECILTEK